MRPHVERVFGYWNEASQAERFRASTDPGSHLIVEVKAEPVGCLWVREHQDSHELVRLYLLERFQGLGIGSRILQRLCSRADEAGLPLRLRILRGNPAARLYQRFGFLEVGQTETRIHMARRLTRRCS